MAVKKIQITALGIGVSLMLLISGCNEPQSSAPPPPQVISKKISRPLAKPKPVPSKKADTQTPTPKGVPIDAKADKVSVPPALAPVTPSHYDATGKIDPFKPLFQASVETPDDSRKKRPPRILTPLEKIELSQIRLVAVIVLKNRRIAMVEEASGKGYEVGVGTYIGRNQGRIAQIKDSSIIVKEPVKDIMGRLSERVQEIKLHKNDFEE